MEDYKVDTVYVTRCKDCKSSIGNKGCTVICLKGFGVVPVHGLYRQRGLPDGILRLRRR